QQLPPALRLSAGRALEPTAFGLSRVLFHEDIVAPDIRTRNPDRLRDPRAACPYPREKLIPNATLRAAVSARPSRMRSRAKSARRLVLTVGSGSESTSLATSSRTLNSPKLRSVGSGLARDTT